MSLYRGVRYHLKEVRQADQRPENAKELFNLRHSSLRNVIKRIFRVLKWQWQILGGKGCEYSIKSQIDLFCVLIRLYNFGKQHGEALFKEEAINIKGGEVVQVEEVGGTGNTQINQKRDAITTIMWNNY